MAPNMIKLKLFLAFFYLGGSWLGYAAPLEFSDLELQIRFRTLPDFNQTTRSQPSALKKINPEDLPQMFPDGNLKNLITAIERQIIRCAQQPMAKTWRFDDRIVTRQEWCLDTNRAMLTLAKASENFVIFWEKAKSRFEWYQSTGKDAASTVQFTGYYLPLLNASRSYDAHFNYPIYKKPNDLVRVWANNRYQWQKVNGDGTYSPYFSRREIDWDYALQGNQLEMIYVDDPIEAFFLHIQGSGIAKLEDSNGNETHIFVNYAAQNGHPYVSIGKLLKNEGVDKKYLTLQGLRKYFQENAGELDRVFPPNPSYVFFREMLKGPYGSGSTILVPGHSIATDNGIFPLGAMALISTAKPIVSEGEIIAWENFSRLAVNQDTGGAIKGPGRVDIYWGYGEYAELAAGSLNHPGQLFFALLPQKTH